MIQATLEYFIVAKLTGTDVALNSTYVILVKRGLRSNTRLRLARGMHVPTPIVLQVHSNRLCRFKTFAWLQTKI